MTQAICIHAFGGPETLQFESVDVPAPGPNEVRVRHTHIGVNYIDVYFRTGLYPPAAMPFTPGVEAAGEVVAVGDAVTGLQPGQRVAYAARPPGAYAEERIIPADRLVPLPDAIHNEQAAAMMLKGMTAHMLLAQIHAVQPGEPVLIHAAAGGVGLIACQWAKQLGATVIGTVGSEEKAELAQAHGCDHPILYRREDITERVRHFTGGEGVAAVYDSVGADTLMTSMDCLAKRGMLVSFGQSSGKPPAIEVGQLAAGGSLFLTRPTLFDYIGTAADLQHSAEALFDVIERGAVTVQVGQRLPLANAAEAHRALEARETTGSTVLIA
ncbi:quinone oxidoreductase family protein [Spiribacter salinus]|uniref:quinone oxidoreductase family protein n=1 Tax=Spiribacter salinus TaxID=1335746 RepID=UPI001C96BC54|nr:quinone oxidoreductase [Spiribacter salinus]MBY5268632.1 quinone oxidoreductase [Spiribacter salinus]